MRATVLCGACSEQCVRKTLSRMARKQVRRGVAVALLGGCRCSNIKYLSGNGCALRVHVANTQSVRADAMMIRADHMAV